MVCNCGQALDSQPRGTYTSNVPKKNAIDLEHPIWAGIVRCRRSSRIRSVVHGDNTHEEVEQFSGSATTIERLSRRLLT